MKIDNLMRKKIAKRIIPGLVLVSSLLALLLAACAPAASPPGQTFEVKRGDLTINVSADGSLTMPDTFDLRFGTPGSVLDIQVVEQPPGAGVRLIFGTANISKGKPEAKPLVEEGDRVKQGALMAFLDNTTKKNAIRTALFNLQTTVNSIPVGTCGTLSDLPNNYPDLSVLRIFEEAQKDLVECIGYFGKGEYKDAGYKLAMTYFDIEVCEDLLQSRPNAAVLAGAKNNSVYYADGTAGSDWRMWENDTRVIAYLQKYRERLLNISWLMRKGDYIGVKHELEAARQELSKSKQVVENTIHIRGRTLLTLPDTPTSLDFLQASLRSLQDLDAYSAQVDTSSVNIAKKLYLARLNLALGRDTLENQTLVYDWTSRSNWKDLQQYNLNVQSSEVVFYKAKRDIMNTVIIAPVDGTVVSVDLKQGSVLSAQDYSTRTAIKLVDTRRVRFTGKVDEIDIMKVQKGQRARITVDAVPGKMFTGRVTFISPFGTQVGQVIKFDVTIEMDPTDVELRGGLSATADINVYSARNALLVPISAITFTPAGPVVTVINEATGKTEDRKITLGKQSFEFAEVLSGLKEGDKVRGSTEKGRIFSPPPPRSAMPVPLPRR